MFSLFYRINGDDCGALCRVDLMAMGYFKVDHLNFICA